MKTKRLSLSLSFASLLLALCCMAMVGCQSGPTNIPEEDSIALAEGTRMAAFESMSDDPIVAAINGYLVDSVGVGYLQGDICIPYPFIINTIDDNPDDVMVWGDFWLCHYILESDDFMRAVSGGNHAGLMHLKKTAEGYQVTKFEGVEDGSDFLPSAKAIFGQYYDRYQEVSSNQELRQENWVAMTAQYVRDHHLKVVCYKDFDGTIVKLPL